MRVSDFASADEHDDLDLRAFFDRGGVPGGFADDLFVEFNSHTGGIDLEVFEEAPDVEGGWNLAGFAIYFDGNQLLCNLLS